MKKSIEKPMNQNVNACLCISEKIIISGIIGKERMLHKTLMKKIQILIPQAQPNNC